MKDSENASIILDVGAGESGRHRPDATHTLDIRELDEVDFPGVDIATDRWPIDDGQVRKAYLDDILEHIPRTHLDHVFEELARTVSEGGEVHISTPHVGTMAAWGNPTHTGPGGYSLGILQFFPTTSGHSRWEWFDVESAEAEFATPTFLDPSRRVTVSTEIEWLGDAISKLPFVWGSVEITLLRR